MVLVLQCWCAYPVMLLPVGVLQDDADEPAEEHQTLGSYRVPVQTSFLCSVMILDFNEMTTCFWMSLDRFMNCMAA